MQCSSCSFENPARATFCGGCGHPLAAGCPECGFSNPAAFRFCGQCGAKLVAEPEVDRAELRHMTVMFCDLVDSTALSEALDPEEYRTLVKDYQHAVSQVVDSWRGHLAQYLGDGVLVYFGYPRAREDDALRAVQAGLEITQEVSRISPTWELNHGVRVRVRVGVHTGTVIAGTIGSGAKADELALGMAPNVAARLQGLAAPDEVVLSDATHEVIRRQFDSNPMGSHQLKGVQEPVMVYRAGGPRAPDEELNQVPSRFIGRSAELAKLLDLHAMAARGSGQLVLVTGEPGIGKSRLVVELKRRLVGQAQWLTSRCSTYHENVDLYPVVEMLKGRIGLSDAASIDQQMDDLATWLGSYGLNTEATRQSLANILDIGDQGSQQSTQIRQQGFETLLQCFHAAAEKQPLVLFLEDAHWADPSTLNLISLLSGSVGDHAILVVLTARPGFVPSWQTLVNHSFLQLHRLGRQDVESILQANIDLSLPPRIVEQIVDRSDGVPLYLEELTAAAVTGSKEARDDLDFERFVPASLQDAMMARIDALGRAKEIVQIGALLGRSFGYEMLLAASDQSPNQLDEGLNRVLDSGILHRIGAGYKAVLRFKHSLIQDTAYDSILRSRRIELHNQVVRALEENFPEIAASEPDLLARHLEGAERPEEAVSTYMKAGAKANDRCAYVESIRSYTKARQLLELLPDDERRNQLEYGLLVALADPLRANGGYENIALRPVIDRIVELGSTQADQHSRYGILLSEWGFHCTRGHRKETLQFAQELERLVAADPKPSLTIGVLFVAGSNRFYQGDFRDAREKLQKCIDLYEERRVFGQRSRDLDQPIFLARIVLGWCLDLLGYPQQAARLLDETLAVAERHEASFAISQCLTWMSFCDHDMERDPDVLLARARHMVAVTSEHGMDLGHSAARRRLLAARVRSGETAVLQEYLATLNRAADTTMVTSGAEFARDAATLIEVGELDVAQKLLNVGIGMLNTNLGTLHAAETMRVQGLLLKRRNDDTGSIAHIEKAIGLARKSGARSQELLAHLSLAEFHPDVAEQSRNRFVELLASFTEGHDEPLLVRAAAVAGGD